MNPLETHIDWTSDDVADHRELDHALAAHYLKDRPAHFRRNVDHHWAKNRSVSRIAARVSAIPQLSWPANAGHPAGFCMISQE